MKENFNAILHCWLPGSIHGLSWSFRESEASLKTIVFSTSLELVAAAVCCFYNKIIDIAIIITAN